MTGCFWFVQLLFLWTNTFEYILYHRNLFQRFCQVELPFKLLTLFCPPSTVCHISMWKCVLSSPPVSSVSSGPADAAVMMALRRVSERERCLSRGAGPGSSGAGSGRWPYRCPSSSYWYRRITRLRRLGRGGEVAGSGSSCLLLPVSPSSSFSLLCPSLGMFSI